MPTVYRRDRMAPLISSYTASRSRSSVAPRSSQPGSSGSPVRAAGSNSIANTSRLRAGPSVPPTQRSSAVTHWRSSCGRIFFSEEIAERYFSPHEVAELRSLPPALRAEGFFLCWTRKEAYVKARGNGLQIPLKSFQVGLTPNEPEYLNSADSERWMLRALRPAVGFVGAILAEGQDWELRCWDWARENSA